MNADNPARPAPGVAIAHLSDIADGGAVTRDFTAGEAAFSLVVCRRGAQVAAFENRCPHARFPLERLDGSVWVQEGRYLVCAAHGASFDLMTGKAEGGPGSGAGLTPFAVRLDGDVIVAAEAA